jgi:hypothetical protein
MESLIEKLGHIAINRKYTYYHCQSSLFFNKNVIHTLFCTFFKYSTLNSIVMQPALLSHKSSC